MLIARNTSDGIEINQEMVDAIVGNIERRDIGWSVVDSLAASHGVNENSNSEMAQLLAIWRGIANRTNSSLLLNHHARKGGRNGTEATSDAARGASAIGDAVRSTRQVRVLTTEEAGRYAITEAERHQYLVVEAAKASASVRGATTWIKLGSVTLDNLETVGVAERWTPPDALDGVTPDHLDQVVASLAARGPQRASPQSSASFGWTVATLCGVPGAAERSDTARVKASSLLVLLAKTGHIRQTTIRERGQDRPVWEAVQ